MDSVAINRFFEQPSRRDLLEKLYPRAYTVPNGYVSPKAVAQALCWPSILMVGRAESEAVDEVAVHGHMTTAKLLKFEIPTFFVDSLFMSAIRATDPPEDTQLESIKWPFEGMLFLFKKGILMSPVDGDCPYLAISRHRAGDVLNTNFPGADPTRASCDCFTFLTSPIRPGGAAPLFGSLVGLEETPTFSSVMHIEREGWVFFGPDAQQDLPPDDQTFIKQIIDLGLRLVLTMVARPDLVTNGHKLPQDEKLKQKGAKEVWKPNFLGHAYRPKRENVPGDGEEEMPGSDHFGPRCHWRRGHYRNQAHGRNFGQRRLIWIEPILVGTPSEER